MSERGLKQVVQSPDLLIGYHAAVDQIDREQLEQLYEGFNWEIDHQYGDEEESWNKAALIMFVFDGNTGELLWQASAEAVVMDKLTDEQRLARVRKGVDLMLQELPKKTQQ
jgi:hypothetical protein